MITCDGIYLITSVDDEYITISANVMITPVIPATHLTSSSIGFCEVKHSEIELPIDETGTTQFNGFRK